MKYYLTAMITTVTVILYRIGMAAMSTLEQLEIGLQ